MSDDEDDTCMFGTALPKLPEDVVPTKKPITVADQIAVDINGRRRFHGAFTGGFSAGYWNTVGSKEGWQPREFKSSRAEKASRVQQAPNDFMDDEDMGEFGIAPQRIQTTDDFRSDKKSGRKRDASQLDDSADGPILGTPVLNLFLKPAKDKASVSLLKKMGWRENQGVGKRLTKKEKQITTKMAAKEKNIYRCDLGPFAKMVTAENAGDDKENDSDDDDASSDSDTEITFAPDDYEPLIQAFKTNRFGLGYSGLDKGHSVLYSGSGGGGHVQLFSADPLVLLGKKGNQKLSIRGQAFGVGAFEEDDDDIYAKEDLSTYDFSLADKKPKEQLKIQDKKHSNIIEGFAPANTQQSYKKDVFLVDIPRSFQPRNWAQRKTRFGPATAILPPSADQSATESTATAETIVGTRRHMLTPEERGQILNDETNKNSPIVLPPQQPIIIIDKTIPEPKPIDEFIKLDEPIKVNEIPAQKPKLKNTTLESLLNDTRFVSEKDLNKTELTDKVVELAPVPQSTIKEVKIQMKREKKIWSPCPLLCQRMNIAEPMSSKVNVFHHKPNGSFSLFECLSGGKSTKKGSKRNRRNDGGEREFTPAEDSDVNSSLMHMTSGSSQKLVENTHINDILPNITATTTKTSAPKVVVPEKLDKPTTQIVPIVTKVKSEPKTELELKIMDAETKHPSEKKDIYKAIFDSSDEDEDNDTNGNGTDNNDKNKDIIQPPALPEHVTITKLPKLSKDFNILRNTSPPRGIFANFLSSPVITPITTEKNPPQLDNKKEKDIIDEKSNETELQSTENSYGPALPTRLLEKPIPPKNKHSFVKPSISKGNNDQNQNIFTSMRPSTLSSSLPIIKNPEKLTFQKPLPSITGQDRRSLSFTNEDKESASSSNSSSDDQDEWVDATTSTTITTHKKSKKPKEKRKKSKKDKKHKSKTSKKHKKKSSKDKR